MNKGFALLDFSNWLAPSHITNVELVKIITTYLNVMSCNCFLKHIEAFWSQLGKMCGNFWISLFEVGAHQDQFRRLTVVCETKWSKTK